MTLAAFVGLTFVAYALNNTVYRLMGL